MVFFFKQKTAYEMRISAWSSDVCSSELLYLKAGADGLFVESPLDVDELAAVGRHFDAPLLANMLESGRTPILKPSELAGMGYAMAIYGITLLMHVTRLMQEVLGALTRERIEMTGQANGLGESGKGP